MNNKIFINSLFLCILSLLFVSGCKKEPNDSIFSYNVKTVKRAIELGADINTKGQIGRTPLHKAITTGRLEIAEMLIEKGAMIDSADDNGWTPLFIACIASKEHGNDGILLLLENGADIHASDLEGRKPIHFVAGYGSIQALDILCKRGADPEAKNNRGETPLHHAVRDGRTAMAKSLIELGVDISIKDTFGFTLLTNALARADAVMAQLIIEAMDAQGLDVGILQPIHRQVIMGNTSAVEKLINNGSLVSETIHGGFTVLELMTRLHPDEEALIKLVKEAAAKEGVN